MKTKEDSTSRRTFLKTALVSTLGAAFTPNTASAFTQSDLQVWSCGGLAEAMIPANALFEKKTGVKIGYTGAFAAALGKSLLGSAGTEVFAGRVLDLAKKLREAGKMEYFKPLCFTSYVMVTPKGNPAGIRTIEDMAKPGIRVVLAPEASPPGVLGDAAARGRASLSREIPTIPLQVPATSCSRWEKWAATSSNFSSDIDLMVFFDPAAQGARA